MYSFLHCTHRHHAPPHNKNQNKNTYQEISEYVSKYHECSIEESNQYIPLLGPLGVKNILSKMGVDEKELKKIIKKAKLK